MQVNAEALNACSYLKSVVYGSL